MTEWSHGLWGDGEIELQISIRAIGYSPLRPPGPGSVLFEFGVTVAKESSRLETVRQAFSNRESLVSGCGGSFEVQMIGRAGSKGIGGGQGKFGPEISRRAGVARGDRGRRNASLFDQCAVSVLQANGQGIISVDARDAYGHRRNMH